MRFSYVILVLFLILSSFAFASTLVVNSTSSACAVSSGSYYSTIQSAVDAASGGDTIIVCDGTYSENPYISKSINLYGNQSGTALGGEITVENANFTNITNLSITSSCSQALYLTRSSYDTISNVSLSPSGGCSWYSLFQVYNSNYNNISNINISSDRTHGIDLSGSTGNRFSNISVSTADNYFSLQISSSENNNFTDVFLNSSLVYYSYDATQCNNPFSNVVDRLNRPILTYQNQIGVNLDGDNISQLVLCNVSSSNIKNLNFSSRYYRFSSALYAFNSNSNNFTNNLFNMSSVSGGGASFVSSFSNTFANNLITNGNDGFYLYGSDSNQILYNDFVSNNYGVYFDTGSDSNSMLNNNFTNNYNGFYLYQANDNQIGYNNIVSSYMSFGSSCPFIYFWNGSSFDFRSDFSSSGHLGPSKKGTPRTYYDYLKIPGDEFVNTGDSYQLKLTEELDEFSYIDKLSLTTVDHSPDYDVYNGFNRANKTSFYTVSKSLSPIVSCTDELSNDCLDAVSTKDGIYTQNNTGSQKIYTIDLGNVSGPAPVKLVISYSKDMNDALANSSRSIQIKNSSGVWTTLYTNSQILSPPNAPNTYVLDLTGLLHYNGEVKLILPEGLLDYLAVDRSDQQPITVRESLPDYADLHYRGFSEGLGDTIQNFDYNSLVSHINANPTGNFTRYGNVTELLTQTDDKYVILHSGDEISVSYPYSAPENGSVRDLFVYGYYYYKTPDSKLFNYTVDPLPFAAMSNYPYALNESYPSDASHLQYLQTYNTRQYNLSAASSFPNSFNNSVFENNFVGYGDGYGIYLSYENSTKLLNNNISAYQYGIYLTGSDQSLIEGNNITNSTYYNGASYGYGIYVDNDMLIGNNIIRNNTITAYLPAYGIYSYYTIHTNITNNKIYNSYNGIYLDTNDYSFVDGNYVYNSTNTGIYQDGYYQNGGNIISNNNVDQVSGSTDGIYINGGYYTNVTGNNITNAYDTIYLDSADFVQIRNNTLTNMTDSGVYIYGYDSYGDNLVSGNWINTTDYGMYLEGAYLTNITSNQIYSGYIALYLDGDTNQNLVLHNRIQSDSWVLDNSGSNYYNDSYSGNIYYLLNGTSSWDYYYSIDNSYLSNDTSVPQDGWADTGWVPYDSMHNQNSEWSSDGADFHPAIVDNPAIRSISLSMLSPSVNGNASDPVTFQYNVSTGWTGQNITECNLTVLSDKGIELSQSSDLAPGLVGLWHFNGDLNDSSGNSNNGVADGGSFSSDYIFGSSSYDIPYANSISVPDSESLNITGNITLSAWVKTSDISHDGIIVSKIYFHYPDGNPNMGYALRKEGSNWVFNLGNGSASGWSDTISTGPVLVTTDSWSHIVGTYNGTTMILYLNGRNVSNYDVSIRSIGAVDQPLSFGRALGPGDNYWESTNGYFFGQIDEVAIWNRSLSFDEVSALYDMEHIRYNSSSTSVTKDALSNFQLSLPNGNYTWSLQCIDNIGISEQSSYRSLSVVPKESTPTPSDSGNSKSRVTLSKSDFNCSSGQITILATSGGDAVSDIDVNLFSTQDFESYSATTDSNGNAVFTIPNSGVFEVQSSSTSQYYPAQMDPFELELCKAQTQVPQSNSTDLGQIDNNSTQTQNVTLPTNETTTSNETATGMIQNSSESSTQTNNTQNNQTDRDKIDAQNAIELAKNAIDSNPDLDTSGARAKLDQANRAFENGDYGSAIRFANDARQSVLNSQAIAPSTQGQNPNQNGFDWLWVLLLLVLGIGIFGGYYLFAKKKRR